VTKNAIDVVSMYETDFAEPPSEVHPAVSVFRVLMNTPVQLAPSNHEIVADIAGDAETKRAVVMNANLNCILTGGLDSF
jgi:hypothetical protein